MIETVLTCARAAHLWAALLAVGLLAFERFVTVRALGPRPTRPMRPALARSALLLLALALTLGCLWLVLQAADLSDSITLAGTLHALVPTAFQTRFGKVLLVRLALLGGAAVLLARPQPSGPSGARMWLALALGVAGLAGHGASGHAAALEDGTAWITVVSVAAHLLAAAAWLGGIAGLLLVARRLDIVELYRVSRQFSPYGQGVVVFIAATALAQALVLFGGLPGLFGTAYGQVALAKAALMVLMLGLAAANRWAWTPRLRDARQPATARRYLIRSMAIEGLLGTAIVVLAAFLAALPPGIHEQPDWPFARRLSTEVLLDPDLGPGLQRTLALGALGLALVLFGLARRRWRLPALLFGAALIAVALPSWDLLTGTAYPTSFWASPTGFTAASVAAGEAVYDGQCAACHGPSGKGDGPQAAALPVPPADLTAEHLWAHTDGDLFWWVSHGMPGPDGSLVMPAFEATLGEDERWAVIDYIHALNAAAWRREGRGPWQAAVAAPDASVTCRDGQMRRLADLHGTPILVAIGAPAPALDGNGITTLAVGDGPGDADCWTADPNVMAAYAMMAGSPALGLIDRSGWMRDALAAAASAGEIRKLVDGYEQRPIAGAKAHRH